jgi:hypothetical protein
MAMKEIPILYSIPMVQAILDLLKRMTRRTRGLEKINQFPDLWICVGTYHILTNDTFEAVFEHKITKQTITTKCPYGLYGDLLWVRESYLKPPFITQKLLREGADTWPKFDYKASCDEMEIEQYKEWNWQIKPSIHMPKAAARIWLQVEEIRVERLHDISEEDAIDEGVLRYINSENKIKFLNYLPAKPGHVKRVTHFGHGYKYSEAESARYSFQTLWIKINGSESWDSNPWVWVVKFKILSTTGKPQFETLNP